MIYPAYSWVGSSASTRRAELTNGWDEVDRLEAGSGLKKVLWKITAGGWRGVINVGSAEPLISPTVLQQNL